MLGMVFTCQFPIVLDFPPPVAISQMWSPGVTYSLKVVSGVFTKLLFI